MHICIVERPMEVPRLCSLIQHASHAMSFDFSAIYVVILSTLVKDKKDPLNQFLVSKNMGLEYKHVQIGRTDST